MPNLKLLILLFFINVTACAQDSVHIEPHLLGNDTLFFHLSIFYPHSPDVTFINLHDDENTSVDAGMNFLSRYGGTLIQLQHNGNRIFRFSIDSMDYGFDPNRIFTENGLKATLEKQGRYSDTAFESVQTLADTLLYRYVNDKKLVIALHNNTDRGLSILSYKRGGFEEQNAAKIYINKHNSPHDFILTTNEEIFNHLKRKRINTVLQRSKPEDDGSLSVYAATKKISYVNIEALHGHLDEQLNMLEALKDIIFRY